MISQLSSLAPLFVMLGSPAPLLAQTAVTAEAANAASLAETVSRFEEDFLSKVTNAPEPTEVFDEFEAQLQRLMREFPGRAEPFVGQMELFEKCEAERALRLLDAALARTDLPPKIRASYETLRRTASRVGTPVNLSFTALDGQPIHFDQLRGKVVVIDFWATWCGPCVRELPKLQTLHGQHSRAGLVIVGVSFDRERTKLDTFLAARRIPWAQVYPGPGERETLLQATGVSGGYLPTVFIVGKDGRLRHTLNSRFRLEAKIEALLKE